MQSRAMPRALFHRRTRQHRTPLLCLLYNLYNQRLNRQNLPHRQPQLL
jgi:hypothetical protein